MKTYLALRDKRAEGGVPARANLRIINVTQNTQLISALSEINNYSKTGFIHTLFIICHGYVKGIEKESERMSKSIGGGGLELGSQGVYHNNVSLWETIKGSVMNIVIYACSAAETDSGSELTAWDGRYLMGALAIHTNAWVYAADKPQLYSTYKNLSNGRYEFGGWEGRLWCFSPSGGSPKIVRRAPVEFSDVMSEVAP